MESSSAQPEDTNSAHILSDSADPDEDAQLQAALRLSMTGYCDGNWEHRPSSNCFDRARKLSTAAAHNAHCMQEAALRMLSGGSMYPSVFETLRFSTDSEGAAEAFKAAEDAAQRAEALFEPSCEGGVPALTTRLLQQSERQRPQLALQPCQHWQ